MKVVLYHSPSSMQGNEWRGQSWPCHLEDHWMWNPYFWLLGSMYSSFFWNNILLINLLLMLLLAFFRFLTAPQLTDDFLFNFAKLFADHAIWMLITLKAIGLPWKWLVYTIGKLIMTLHNTIVKWYTSKGPCQCSWWLIDSFLTILNLTSTLSCGISRPQTLLSILVPRYLSLQPVKIMIINHLL